jgi:hypothetical protein
MKNMTEYEYRGFLICSYLKNSRNTKYWMVELNGKEVAADYSTLAGAQNWVDVWGREFKDCLVSGSYTETRIIRVA